MTEDEWLDEGRGLTMFPFHAAETHESRFRPP
jgi:hypothetical protein